MNEESSQLASFEFLIFGFATVFVTVQCRKYEYEYVLVLHEATTIKSKSRDTVTASLLHDPSSITIAALASTIKKLKKKRKRAPISIYPQLLFKGETTTTSTTSKMASTSNAVDPLRAYLDAVTIRLAALESHCGIVCTGSPAPSSPSKASMSSLQKAPSARHIAGSGKCYCRKNFSCVVLTL